MEVLLFLVLLGDKVAHERVFVLLSPQRQGRGTMTSRSVCRCAAKASRLARGYLIRRLGLVVVLRLIHDLETEGSVCSSHSTETLDAHELDRNRLSLYPMLFLHRLPKGLEVEAGPGSGRRRSLRT